MTDHGPMETLTHADRDQEVNRSNQTSVGDPPNRTLFLGVSVLIGCVIIAGLSLVLEGQAGIIVLDKADSSYDSLFFYPFTIQNLLYIIFCLGVGDLVVRWRTAQREQHFLDMNFLPEDFRTVLQAKDLGPIRKRVDGLFDGEHGFLPSLINLSILQFRASNSVDQTVSVLNSSLELISDRVYLRYSMLRYMAWVIPTIGFIGTVLGIAWTLMSVVDPNEPDLGNLFRRLGLAFNTTLVALILSGILMLFLHVVQEKEEKAVNQAGDYCLQNLINRLYESGA